MYPTTGTFGDIIQQYFPSATDAQKADLWSGFLKDEGIAAGGTPPASDAAAFTTFALQQSSVYPDAVTYGNLTNYPQSGVYGNILNQFFVGADAAQKQALWSSFLWSHGLAIAPGDNSLAQDLATYIQINSSAFPLEATTFPTTGPYGSVLQAYYGNQTAEQKQAIWTAFLQYQGLTIPPTDNSQLGNFVQFISQSYATTSQASQSPGQIQQNQVMYQTFDAVLEMLNTLQNTVSVQSNSLIFYSKLQEAYTQMLTSTPVYVGSPTVWTPNADATQFKLGYNDISVDDIANYMATNSASSPTFSAISSSISLGTNYSAPIPFTLSVKLFYSGGTPTAQLIFEQTSPIAGVTTSPTAVVAQTTANSSSKTDWDAAIIKLLTSPSGSSQNPNYSVQYNPPSGSFIGGYTVNQAGALVGDSSTNHYIFTGMGIPWRETEPYTSTTLTTAQQQANTNASEARSELNSQLQQYIANTRALRSAVQTSAKTEQTDVSTSKQTITNQSSLLTSILQTTYTVVQSIFNMRT